MDVYKDILNDDLPDAAPYMGRFSFPSGEFLFELHTLWNIQCRFSQKHLTSMYDLSHGVSSSVCDGGTSHDLESVNVLLHSLSICSASADALQSILELQDSSLPTMDETDHRYAHSHSFIYCDAQGSLSYVMSGFVPQVRSRLTPQCSFDRLSCDGILDGDPLYKELSLSSKEPIYSEAQSSNELLDSPYRIPPLYDDFWDDCPLPNKASSNHFMTGSEGSRRWELHN